MESKTGEVEKAILAVQAEVSSLMEFRRIFQIGRGRRPKQLKMVYFGSSLDTLVQSLLDVSEGLVHVKAELQREGVVEQLKRIKR